MCNRITLRFSLLRANRKLRKREEQSNVEPHSASLSQSADARERQLTHASHPLLALGKLPPENNNARSRRHTHKTLSTLSSQLHRTWKTPVRSRPCRFAIPRKHLFFALDDERGTMKGRNRSSDKTEGQCRRKPPLLRTWPPEKCKHSKDAPSPNPNLSSNVVGGSPSASCRKWMEGGEVRERSGECGNGNPKVDAQGEEPCEGRQSGNCVSLLIKTSPSPPGLSS